MTANSTRYWMMDWHGWMIDHDPVSDIFVRRPFQPGRYPGVSFLVPPQDLPAPVTTEKTVSMPRLLPELDLLRTETTGLVALSRRNHPGFLTCAPVPGDYGEVHFNSTTLQEWEHFLPLTDSSLRGLGILLEPEASDLRTEEGTPVPAPTLRDSMTAQTDDFRFSLVDSLEGLAAISTLGKGQRLTLSLKEHAGENRRTLVVTRGNKA